MEGIGEAIDFAFKFLIGLALAAGIGIGACGSCVAHRYSVRVERKP